MPEYTRETIEKALRNADAAGDVQGARELAKYYKENFGSSLDTQEPTVVPSDPLESSQDQQEKPWYDQTIEFFKKNMDIPVGMGGAIGGAVAGAPLGPVGMAAGGILGGMAGSAGGSLLSDELQGENLQYGKAVEMALVSLGFDIATLGLGKILKPAFIAGKKALGYSPEEVAQQIIEGSAKAGSRESLTASQRILEANGATLTPTQIGANGVDILMEKIANSGIISQQYVQGNAAKVNKIVEESLTEVMDRHAINMGTDPESIGKALYDLIDEGKRAASLVYEKSLNDIMAGVGNKRANIYGIHNTVKQFLKEGKTSFGTTYDNRTLAFIKQNFSTLPPDMKLSELLAFDKKINAQITSMGAFNSDVPPHVQQQLAEFSSRVRQSIQAEFSRVDPKNAAKFSEMKGAYSEAMDGLLPEINKGFLTSAKKENYQGLGNLIVTSNNTSQIQKLLGSVDEAFKQVENATGGVPRDFIAKEEAYSLIKKGFLEKTFPSLPQGNFNIQNYKNLANQFSTPQGKKKLKLILGEDYGKVKQLMNLMAEASEKPTSNLGELALRTKEYQSLGTGVALGVGYYSGGVLPIALAGAVLTAPVVMAKISLNPKNINKLLAYQNKAFRNDEAKMKALTFVMSDILDGLNSGEMDELRAYLYNSYGEEQQQ